MRIYKGDMFYADLTPVVGCEQGGIRPVLIIQNDIGNRSRNWAVFYFTFLKFHVVTFFN